MSTYRSPLHFANTVDYEAMKRHAFHDQGVLVVRLDDPNIAWPEREILKAVGERLYGAPKPAGR